MLRITNKSGDFLRDDFIFDPETETGLDVEPAQGLYKPKWDGEKWVEGATQEYINGIIAQQPAEPTLEELHAQLILIQEQIDNLGAIKD